MRTTSAVPRNRAKKRLFRKVKGFVGGRRRLLRTATEALVRSGTYATAHRRLRKRDFRKLWIIRINAAVRERGLRTANSSTVWPSRKWSWTAKHSPKWPSAIRPVSIWWSSRSRDCSRLPEARWQSDRRCMPTSDAASFLAQPGDGLGRTSSTSFGAGLASRHWLD